MIAPSLATPPGDLVNIDHGVLTPGLALTTPEGTEVDTRLDVPPVLELSLAIAMRMVAFAGTDAVVVAVIEVPAVVLDADPTKVAERAKEPPPP
jgi:hypothetical protein